MESADIFILFSDGNSGARGGKHVEFGYALSSCAHIWVVGERENIFQFLPEVSLYRTWDDVLEMLDVL